jgi:hypothetical protein
MAAEVEVRPLRYNTVAASQTAQALVLPADTVAGQAAGAGAKGDILETLLVVPASTSPGAVTLVDGGVSVTVFAGGAGSVTDLKPFLIFVGARSQSTAWKVTTGASVSVVASGRFT